MSVNYVRVGMSVMYGAALIVGGILGYARQKSVISAVAGCSSGFGVLALEWVFVGRSQQPAADMTSRIVMGQLAMSMVLAGLCC